jgi:hypothetical protein
MPDIVLWPLFIAFAAITISATIKAVEALHGKKLSDDECTRLRVQLDALNKPADKKTVDHKPIDSLTENQEANHDNKVNTDLDTFHNILALIAKYHSQEIQATPKRIAADLGLDPEITLTHMWKHHNEQFITFRNGDKKPELDTPFFLSPKAWEHITIVRA